MIKLKRLDPRAVTPTRGSVDAACWDLYALEDVSFKPGEIKLVKTGWAAKPPAGLRINLYVRSSTPIKKGFILANSVGVIDPDYRGDMMFQLLNVKREDAPSCVGDSVNVENFIKAGDKIGQMELVSHYHRDIEIVEDLDETERGDGGFGSSGD